MIGVFGIGVATASGLVSGNLTPSFALSYGPNVNDSANSKAPELEIKILLLAAEVGQTKGFSG